VEENDSDSSHNRSDNIIDAPETSPEWFMTGRTTLIPTKEETNGKPSFRTKNQLV